MTRWPARLSTANDARAQVVALALVLGAYEDHTGVQTWRHPGPAARRYLAALVEWGYEPSEVEEIVLAEPETS